MPLSSEDHRRLGEELKALIAALGIRYQRGDIVRMFALLGPILEGFSVCPLDREDCIQATRAKYIFTLWNILVDDDIDRDGSSTELMRSLLTLTHTVKNGEYTPTPGESPSQRVLGLLFSILQESRPLDECQHVMFGIHKHATGFYYEWLANHRNAANSPEYSALSVLTADVSLYVDIDHTIKGQSFANPHYPRIRAACLEFARAVKYASDVGSLERELKEEQNHNFITIRTLETLGGARPRDDVTGVHAPAREEAMDRARTHFERGIEWLRPIDTTWYDTKPLIQAVDRLVTTYLGGDPFFRPTTLG